MGGAAKRLSRTGWLSVLLGLVLGFGVLVRLAWPDPAPSLPCDPDEVRLTDAGIAVCGAGAELPAAQRLAVGAKLDLNRATEQELALVSGVGPSLARAIVEERTARGGFRSWEDVDEVPGVGPQKLEALMAATEIR